jgi:hypothetical protein
MNETNVPRDVMMVSPNPIHGVCHTVHYIMIAVKVKSLFKSAQLEGINTQ